jgi:hypothetical protein
VTKTKEAVIGFVSLLAVVSMLTIIAMLFFM